jgi:hypothetical protein
MRRLIWFAVVAALCFPKSAPSQEQPSANPKSDTPVFREPFTLKLRVDKDHYYEEHYDKRIPYVAESDVYLFSGEQFGVNLDLKGTQVVTVTYQSDVKKADLWFNLGQPKDLGGVAMSLIIENKLKVWLQMDALMTLPGKKGIYKTSILPVGAGLSDCESWPHPIVQLVLRNFRVVEKPPGESKK